MEKKGQLQVIGAGFGRTGTSSFKKALEILGFGKCYHMSEVIGNSCAADWERYAHNPEDLKLLHSILGGRGYKSSCDFPSASFWQKQLELYPNAKVILTARDPEKWYKSCCDTIFRMQPNYPTTTLGGKIALWMGLPVRGFNSMLNKIISTDTFHDDWSKKNVIKCYNEHNENVVKTCPPERLLVFDVAQGWAPLCEFLGVPIPDVPYPHVNDTREFQRIIMGMTAVGYLTLALGISAVVLVGNKLANGTLCSHFKFSD